MPTFDPVSRPGGYVTYEHEFDPQPRKSHNPTITGTSVVTTHGYLQKKTVVIRFAQADEIESIVASHESGGYVRDGHVSPDFEVGEPVGLYRAKVDFTRYSATG